VSLEECRNIVRDFEPSTEKRRENLLSPQGLHFDADDTKKLDPFAFA